MQNYYIGDKSICSDCLGEFKELLGINQAGQQSGEDGQPGALPEQVPKFQSSAAPMSPEVTASLAPQTAPPVKVVLPKGDGGPATGSSAIPVPAGLSSEVPQSPELEQDPFASMAAPARSPQPSRPSGGGANPLAALGKGGGGSAASRLVANQPGQGAPQPQGGAPQPPRPQRPAGGGANSLAALGKGGGSSAAARLVANQPGQGAPQQRPPQRPGTGVAPQQRPPQRPATGTAQPQRPPQRPATGAAPQQRPPQRPATGAVPQQQPSQNPAAGVVPAQPGAAKPPSKPKGSGPDLTSLLKG